MNNMTITDDLLADIEHEAHIGLTVCLAPNDLLPIINRVRQLESVLREADTYLDISAIHTGSVLHETMRAALGDQP